MATRKSTTAPATVSKADAIRAYHKEHPDATPKEIAEALTKQGVEVNAGRVSGVLRGGSGKVDVETIKRAAAFAAGYNGKLDEAVSAIETVGKFVQECGGAEKAKAALEAYQAVAAAVNGK